MTETKAKQIVLQITLGESHILEIVKKTKTAKHRINYYGQCRRTEPEKEKFFLKAEDEAEKRIVEKHVKTLGVPDDFGYGYRDGWEDWL